MSALDFWVLAIWQVDSYDGPNEAWRLTYAVGVLTLLEWGKRAERCVRGPLPKSLRTEEPAT